MLNRLLGVNDKEDGPPLTLEDACVFDSRENDGLFVREVATLV